MKKKFKKLSLSTETLRNLTDPGLKDVAGGQTFEPSDGETKCTAICTECTRPCTLCITCRPCVP